MAQSILEYILRSKKEGTATKEASAELSNFQKVASKAGGTAKNVLGKGLNAASLGAAALVPFITKAAIESVTLAQDFDKAQLALTAYAGGADEAEAATIAVTNAAGGAISKLQATQTATRLFSMGLAESAEEAGKLTEMAIMLGAAVGEDAQSSIENFSLMLANQSIPRLDSFGISGAAVRERMIELQAATEGLDRQTAFMIATMELGTEKLDALNESGFEATTSIDTLKAATEDFKTEMGEALLPIVEEGARVLTGWVSALTTAVAAENAIKEAAEAGIITRKEANELINQATWTELTFAEALEIVEEKERQATGAQDDLNVSVSQAPEFLVNARGATEDYSDALDDSTTSTDGLKTATDNLVLSMLKVTQAKLAQEAIEALTAAHDEGTISTKIYEESVEAVLTRIAGFTNVEAEASIALQKLKKQFEDGEITALEYYSALQKINQEIKAIPTEKTFTLKLKTSGSLDYGGSGLIGDDDPDWYQAGGQFTVAGPPGIDAVPVSFLATRGERVTITPQGLPGPASSAGGGITINAQGANFYGVGGIQEFADQLLPYIDSAMRNA